MFNNIKAQHQRRDNFLKTVSIQTDLQWAKPCHMAYYIGLYRGNVIDANIERNVLLASHFLSRPHAKWRRRLTAATKSQNNSRTCRRKEDQNCTLSFWNISILFSVPMEQISV
jgi:hypothetical protein